MKSIRSELVLIAILLIGLFLRIYDLGNENIWLDEATSIKFANLNLSGIVEETSNDVHPPLYYIILHFWISLFGDPEFSVRFPSVIFGFFSVFMIYKVGNLVFDKEVGVLGSLVLALSTFHIHYSQEVRMYSLMTLLTLLSMYFFIRLLRERSFIVSVCYMLSSILLMYTHNYGLFIIMAQNIYILTLFLLSEDVYKLSFKRWIQLQLILVVLFTPWVMILMKQILRVEGNYWIPVPSMRSIIKSFKLYSGPNLFYLFLILSFFSIITYEKTRGRIDWKDLFKSIETYKWNISPSDASRVYLLLLWLLTPIVLPFIISQVSVPIYWDRYTIVASIAFYLLAAKGIKNIDCKYVKLAVIGIIITGSLTNAWGYYTAVNKARWGDVADYIDLNSKPGDLLLFNPGYSQITFDYYSKSNDLIKKPFPKKTKHTNEDIKKLESTVVGYNRVWVIQDIVLNMGHDSYKDKGLAKKILSESHNLSYYREHPYDHNPVGIELYLFEKK